MLFLLDKEIINTRWNGLPLHEASSALVSEVLNGDFQLTLRYPITDSKVYSLLEADKLIKSPVPVLGDQLFRIREVEETDDAVEVVAYHISDDIMRRSISPLSLVQLGCQMALTQVVSNSKTSLSPFVLSSDISRLHTFQTDQVETLYTILLDGKHSVVGTWEGELVRDNFLLMVKEARGLDRGVIITTHKTLKSYKRERTNQSVITRIHAHSRVTEGDEERLLSVTVDSPLINSYPYISEAEYENNTAKTIDELRQWATRKFTHEGIDKGLDTIIIEAYELDGQEVHLGDFVRIKSRKHGMDLRKQAVAYQYNALTKTYVSLTFDDKVASGGAGIANPLSGFAKEVLGVGETVQEQAIQEAIRQANSAFEATFQKEKQELEDQIEVASSKATLIKADLEATITAVGRETEKTHQSVREGLERAHHEAETLADRVREQLAGFDLQTQSLSQSVRESDRKAQEALNQAGASRDLAQLAQTLSHQTQEDTRNSLTRALSLKSEALAEAERLHRLLKQELVTQGASLRSSLDSTNQSVQNQARELLSQAQSQGELSRRVRSVEQTAEGTRSSLTEVSNTLNATKNQLVSMTQKVTSTETSLSGVREQFRQLHQTVATQEGQVSHLSQQSADLERGLAGITTRFEQLSVGGRNYVRGSDQMIKGSGTWATATFRQSGSGTTETVDVSDCPIPGITKAMALTGRGVGICQDGFQLEKGIWTISYWVKAPETARVQLHAYWNQTNGASGVRYNIPVVAGWQRVSYTATNEVAGRHSIAYIYYHGQGTCLVTAPQLEQGSLMTDHSLAEEDIRSEVATYKQSLDQNLASLTQTARQLDGKVETVNSLIQQTAIGLAQKAEKTVLDQVTGRLVTAESSLRQQANQISQRLTATQVESAIQAKGYQTKTQVDTNIAGRGYLTAMALRPYVEQTAFDHYQRETAQTIERGLTETRRLIPTKMSDVNLVPDSKLGESSNLYGFGTRRLTLEAGKSYWFAARAKKTGGTSDKTTAIYLYNANWSESYRLAFQESNYDIKSLSFTARHTGTFSISSYWYPSGGDRTGTADVDWYLVVESAIAPTTWSPHPDDLTLATDFNRVKETAHLYERVLGRSEGVLSTNLSRQVMTNQLFQTEVKNPLSQVTTKVSQLSDSYAIRLLTTSGAVLSQLNLNSGGVKLQGKLIQLDGQVTATEAFFRSILADKIETNHLKSGAITTVKLASSSVTAEKVLVNQALIDKLVTNSLWTSRLFAQTGFVTKLKAVELDAGKLTSGYLSASRLQSEAITADKLKVDQAFFTKLMANEAYLRQLFAKSAFITQVQAVTLSASRISGGLLTALNNAMSINLNQANITFNQNATITFNSANNALVRKKGTHTAFVHFNDVAFSSDGGVGSLYASIGVTSSGDGVNSASSGRFCGARFFRGARGTAHGATIDQGEIYGDRILLKDDFSLGRGFKFQPTTIDKMVDMNYLVGAVRSLSRCWLHWNNIGWDPNNNDMRRAIINEYNAHMKDL